MNSSQSPFSIAPPPTTPSEGVWAISVAQRIEPIEAAASQPERGHDADARGWRSWVPTLPEGLAGVMFGATIGALIVFAVALDLEDFTPPASAPTRTGHFLVGGTHVLDVHSPATAPRRAVREVREGREARESRDARARRTKSTASPTTSALPD